MSGLRGLIVWVIEMQATKQHSWTPLYLAWSSRSVAVKRMKALRADAKYFRHSAQYRVAKYERSKS